jgi:DNA-binding transcriptional LysR family regulator
MDRLEAITVFIHVADEGSLAAAARRLRRSPASVTRALAHLEGHLGARLFHRSTRSLRLTQIGERYLETCRRVLTDLAAAESNLGADEVAARGLLSLTSPATFGRLHIYRVMQDLLVAQPGISMRLLFMDRVVNLVEEGFDAAIRIGHLTDSALTGIKLGHVRRVVCASPGYLARSSRPISPADLSSHHCIVMSQSAAEEVWAFPGATKSRQHRVRLRPRLNINDASSAVASAVEGHGIVRVLSYQAERELREGRLVRLLADFEPAPVPVHILTLPERPPKARVRALIDHAVPALRSILARIEKALSDATPTQ